MALIVNGTTIPTNVANALKYNGTNITKVVFNSTTVWTQSLFNAQWSGTSKSVENGWHHFTLSTSGNLFRFVNTYNTGPWITTNINGTFAGNSLIGGGSHGFVTSSNLLKIKGAYGDAKWCTYTVANKAWTGSSQDSYMDGYGYEYNYLDTSGGLIRARKQYVSGGAWISLT